MLRNKHFNWVGYGLQTSTYTLTMVLLLSVPGLHISRRHMLNNLLKYYFIPYRRENYYLYVVSVLFLKDSMFHTISVAGN